MSIMRKAMVFLGLSDDEFDEYGNGAGAQHPQAQQQQYQQQPRQQIQSADYGRGASAIRPLPRIETRQPVAATAPTVIRPAEVREVAPISSQRVHVIEPIEFGDAQEIGDRLKEGHPVLLALADVDPNLARRLIDFCSGATYSLGGSMERAAKNVFLLIPEGVEVSQEEKQRLRERGLYKGK